MKSCHRCAYRKYIGDGASICTHAMVQLTLISRGTPAAMKVSDYPKLCPKESDVVDPDKQGATDIYYLEKLYIKRKASPKHANSRQTSLF